ncbi:MAG: ketopantoate reductase family protein, partial [Erysipelotrichaceae bacterium]|nr:ketopantoate reductase family protein [Erysipelotrichaceae bacterium]
MMTFISAMREALLVAQKEGVAITEDDLNGYVELMSTLSPDNMPSMAQDRINHNPSEVELFSGTVIALGKKHHLYVPVNEYLYRRVKEIEATY